MSSNLNEAKHPTELKTPIQVAAFKEILDEAYQTHLEKNCDYSPANIVYFGEIGVLVRVWDKVCRLLNLNGIEFPLIRPKLLTLIEDIEGGKVTDLQSVAESLRQLHAQADIQWQGIKPKSPKNESIEDAWKDLSVYAMIGLLVRKGAWGR